MSIMCSNPTTTPFASRANGTASRMPGAYASAGSTVSCVNVRDSPGHERMTSCLATTPGRRSEWIGTLPTC